ncbi:hypothetical protein HZS_6846, partial [Henneguya salminicola]
MDEKIYQLPKNVNPILQENIMASSNLNLTPLSSQKNDNRCFVKFSKNLDIMEQNPNLMPLVTRPSKTVNPNYEKKLYLGGLIPGYSVVVKTAYSFQMNEYPAPRYTSPKASCSVAQSCILQISLIVVFSDCSNLHMFMDSYIKDRSFTSFKETDTPKTSAQN